jgi:CubicO group peptidase (beta-lactamase class C family)
MIFPFDSSSVRASVALLGVTLLGGCGAASGLANLSAAPAQQLDALIDEFAAKRLLSGNLHVVFADGSSYERAVQLADDERSLPNHPHTLALISSLSKNYTAAAILVLEEAGKLSVDDPVARFFPEYPARHLQGRDGQPATLHHLMSHTSGIPDAYEDTRIDRKLFKRPIEFADILNAIKARPLETDPGSEFSYSNTGYILLGEVVRRVSHLSFAEFADAKLFQPLSLRRTFVGGALDGSLPFALPYEMEKRRRVNYLRKHHIREMHITDVFTDGNIVATAGDVAAWARQLARQRLLSRASLDKMFHDYGEGYGYGWNVLDGADGRKIISHDGGWVGYSSHVMHSVESGATVAYLLNQSMPEAEESRFKARLKEVVFRDGSPIDD